MDGSPPGSSIHGISQARIQEWIAISFSRGSSSPRDQTLSSCVSCTGNWILYHCTTWEALKNNKRSLTQRVGSGIWEQHSSAILLQDLAWCRLNPSHQKAWLAPEDPVPPWLTWGHTHTHTHGSFRFLPHRPLHGAVVSGHGPRLLREWVIQDSKTEAPMSLVNQPWYIFAIPLGYPGQPSFTVAGNTQGCESRRRDAGSLWKAACHTLLHKGILLFTMEFVLILFSLF